MYKIIRTLFSKQTDTCGLLFFIIYEGLMGLNRRYKYRFKLYNTFLMDFPHIKLVNCAKLLKYYVTLKRQYMRV